MSCLMRRSEVTLIEAFPMYSVVDADPWLASSISLVSVSAPIRTPASAIALPEIATDAALSVFAPMAIAPSPAAPVWVCVLRNDRLSEMYVLKFAAVKTSPDVQVLGVLHAIS